MEIKEDNEFIYTQIVYKDRVELQIKIEKQTGYVSVNMDDVAKIMELGDSFSEYISSDIGLDFINEWNKSYPDMRLFGENGILELCDGKFRLSTKNL